MYTSKIVNLIIWILMIVVIMSITAGFIVKSLDVGIGFWETVFNPIEKTIEALKLWVDSWFQDIIPY